MITDQLNTGLISAMKEKLPQGTNLANLLMDILYIGKEAVYRRLRGEVPFTLAEAAVISQKIGISLDRITGMTIRSRPTTASSNIMQKYSASSKKNPKAN